MNLILEYTLDKLGTLLAKNLEKFIPHTPEKQEEEMSINRKKIRRHVNVNGISVWVTADTEQEYADKILKLSGNSKTTDATERQKFSDYANKWFDIFSKPNVTKATALTYQRQLNFHILPIIGELYLDEITPGNIQEIFNAMPPDAKQETKNKTKIVLNQIFKMACEEDLIAKNPMKSSTLKIKGLASSTTEPYTVQQMRYMMAHLDDIQDQMERAWLALSISLPLRPQEVLGLRWMDVDEKNYILHIRGTVTHPTRNEPQFRPYTKTASSVRDLALSKVIFSHLPPRGKPDEFVIGGKDAVSYTKLRGMRRRIAKAISFDDEITPRRFRTTVATDISAQTHDLKLVQQMLGHSTPQMTLKHYDKGRSTVSDAVDVIGQCYGIK